MVGIRSSGSCTARAGFVVVAPRSCEATPGPGPGTARHGVGRAATDRRGPRARHRRRDPVAPGAPLAGRRCPVRPRGTRRNPIDVGHQIRRYPPRARGAAGGSGSGSRRSGDAARRTLAPSEASSDPHIDRGCHHSADRAGGEDTGCRPGTHEPPPSGAAWGAHQAFRASWRPGMPVSERRGPSVGRTRRGAPFAGIPARFSWSISFEPGRPRALSRPATPPTAPCRGDSQRQGTHDGAGARDKTARGRRSGPSALVPRDGHLPSNAAPPERRKPTGTTNAPARRTGRGRSATSSGQRY